MQIEHRGLYLTMSQQLLNRMQMGAGLQEMRRKGMSQRMDGGVWKIQLLADLDDQALQ